MGNLTGNLVFLSGAISVLFVANLSQPSIFLIFMGKTTSYATEAEIGTARPGAKLNFGGNLYMRVSPRGERAFHFRVCIDGKDTTHSIGKYPDLDLAQARQIARHRQSEVTLARKEKAVAAFRGRLDTIKQRSFPKMAGNLRSSKDASEGAGFIGFRSLEDAGKFLQGLRNARDLVLPELSIWLQLKLLIPSRADHLLDAIWSDLDVENCAWVVRQAVPRRTASHHAVRRVALLSSAARRSLDDLRRITGEGEHLFPTLTKMPASALRNFTKEALSQAWKLYSIDPDEFVAFFEGVASKYSLFHPTLLDGMLTHSPGNLLDYNHGTYVMQLRSLTEWWGETLNWFNFGESSLQWGGAVQVPVPEQGRPKWGRILK